MIISVDSSVEHVVMHTVCTLELPGESADYVLKVVYMLVVKVFVSTLVLYDFIILTIFYLWKHYIT